MAHILQNTTSFIQWNEHWRQAMAYSSSSYKGRLQYKEIISKGGMESKDHFKPSLELLYDSVAPNNRVGRNV